MGFIQMDSPRQPLLVHLYDRCIVSQSRHISNEIKDSTTDIHFNYLKASSISALNELCCLLNNITQAEHETLLLKVGSILEHHSFS